MLPDESASLSSLILPLLPSFTIPDLPKITDPELERQVFTHSSYYARPRKPTSLDLDDEDPILDNEKLEHVGDALLGMMTCSISLYVTISLDLFI